MINPNDISKQVNTRSIFSSTANIIRAFNLQHVKLPDSRNNSYTKEQVQSGYVTPDYTRDSRSGFGKVPIFVDLILHGGYYVDNITQKEVTYPEIRFDTVLVSVDFAQRVVKTEIQGRDGTVKEYIGKDDATITIQGVITGSNGVYPQEDVNALIQWIYAPVTKSVECGFLQNMGINWIVVEGASIPQVAGGYSYQQFSINCVSDLPVEFLLT